MSFPANLMQLKKLQEVIITEKTSHKKTDIYNKYRQVSGKSDHTHKEINVSQEHLIPLALTIFQHIQRKKLQ
jgi:hypothetical protein